MNSYASLLSTCDPVTQDALLMPGLKVEVCFRLDFPFACLDSQLWLEVLQQDPAEIRRQVAEAARKVTLLRVNERSLTRRYTTLMEQEQHLRKENYKLKDDSVRMEAAVTERIGYLQRFKVQHEHVVHIFISKAKIRSWI